MLSILALQAPGHMHDKWLFFYQIASEHHFWSAQLDDEYGSPSLEDMEAFQHALRLKLEATAGNEAAGELEIEVSSPVSLPHCDGHFRRG